VGGGDDEVDDAGEEEEQEGGATSTMFAVIEWYVSALRGDESTHPGVQHSQAHHKLLDLPYVKVESDLRYRYDVVDTKMIASGAWSQEDFDVPGNFWVLWNEHR
jgi:hypothetical protein